MTHEHDHPHPHPHPHTYADRPHPEAVVLDIGGDIGALIIHTKPERHGQEIHISRKGVSKREHVEVLERSINGEPAFTAVFPELREGEYDLWNDLHGAIPAGQVTIAGGAIATLDWR
ncbi:MAG: phospholipase [Chloroflexota bacterium]